MSRLVEEVKTEWAGPTPTVWQLRMERNILAVEVPPGE